MRIGDLREMCLVGVVAERRRTCECPCREAGHLGACRVWIWPGMPYHLGLTARRGRPHGVALCAECVQALGRGGHLDVVENRDVVASEVTRARR